MEFILDLLNLDIVSLSTLGAHNPFYLIWFFFIHGGWILFIITFLFLSPVLWMDWRQGLYAKTIKWIFLAVDVPRNNEQSPKAVEQIFNQIWGSITDYTLWAKLWQGKFMPSFSLELVSIDGYIQYIIRTPKPWRDLIESAIYAQYPDAEIAEIEDYTKDITPDNFVEKGYDLWGTQLQLTNLEYYPIRTYPFFEHSIAKKIVDPMSALLEMMSKLGRGEQLWYQIIIKPVGDDVWKVGAEKLVKKLIGAETKEETQTILDGIFSRLYNTTNFLLPLQSTEQKKEQKLPSKVLYMSKGELETVAAIEMKASKTGFKTKMRMIYIGKKDAFFKPRGLSPFFGALRQYAGANGFKPAGKTATKAEYFFIKPRMLYKQKRILKHYKSRALDAGVKEDGYLLNVEELASVYHFPSIEVPTKMVHTSLSKKVQAPMNIPFDDFFEPEILSKKEPQSTDSITKDSGSTMAPPSNLPI
ncbi:MAG TPA: hypothetical protein PLH37_01845 [bacterium]|nr:hypothetical protein [bacterium]